MARQNVALYAFNRGLVSTSALTRVDVERVRLGAETMVNWLPRSQGNMKLRPGLEYLLTGDVSTQVRDLEFVARTNDTALIELSANQMRIVVDGAYITRPVVTTTIQDPTFATGTGWTETSTVSGLATFGVSGLTLASDAKGRTARVNQQVTPVENGTEHSVVIKVDRGPVRFKIGTAVNLDDYVTETTLRTGEFNFAFVPSSDFWIDISTDDIASRIVESCDIGPSGVLTVTSPWGQDDLYNVDYAQSVDVVFCACDGYRQRRIERRPNNSWGICEYDNRNGPFFVSNTNGVKFKTFVTQGDSTVESDKPYFTSNMVGEIYRIYAERYNIVEDIGGDGFFTKAHKVSGIRESSGTPLYNDRNWGYSIAGTWSGTVTVKRSYEGEFGGYTDFRNSGVDPTIGQTGNVSGIGNEDKDDNTEVWYKLGFNSGDYTSGKAEISIDYDGFSGYGIAKITSVSSSTVAAIEIIGELHGRAAFYDGWERGIWSTANGWPTSVCLSKGRLWWGSTTRVAASISDDYENFDPERVGDSAPIIRTIGNGPADRVNFMLPLGGRIVIGTDGVEHTLKTTSFDEAYTPTNTHLSDESTYGSKFGVRPARVDNTAFYSHGSGRHVLQLVPSENGSNYRGIDAQKLAPNLIPVGVEIVGFAVQRKPDTRVYAWLSDGNVIVLLYEPDERIRCWYRIESDFVEHVSVLPGPDEDRVYLRVKRTVNGSTVRYLERIALENDCTGGNINRLLDSHKYVSHTGSTTISGASHLEGKTVHIWADGAYRGSATVTSGSFPIASGFSDVVYGLSYVADYKSTKLAYAAMAGTALTQMKQVGFVGLIGVDVHNDGLYFGRDFNNLDPLPRRYNAENTTTEVFSEYDQPAMPFPGSWNTDSRVCLRATAPKPCDISALVVGIETNEKL